MKPDLLSPDVVDTTVVDDALSLVGYRLRRVDCTAPWSTLELLVAYDWAMRIHLRAAGNSIRERPIPSRLVETL